MGQKATSGVSPGMEGDSKPVATAFTDAGARVRAGDAWCSSDAAVSSLGGMRHPFLEETEPSQTPAQHERWLGRGGRVPALLDARAA